MFSPRRGSFSLRALRLAVTVLATALGLGRSNPAILAFAVTMFLTLAGGPDQMSHPAWPAHCN